MLKIKSSNASTVIFSDKEANAVSLHTEAFMALFSKVNSILVGRQIECVTAEIEPVACTNGETIYFQRTALDTAFKKFISSSNLKSLLKHIGELRGLNYHE